MASNPFGKLGLQDAEEALKSIGVDAFFRPASERLDGAHVVVDGRRLIMAGSNDYLGLSHHPEVIEAAVAAVRRYGTSVSGSRPLNGTLDLHERLEARLAGFLGQPSAMVVTTGYQANLALSALLGPNDVAFSDARNHASLIEATRLGAGSVQVYRHGDVDHLAELLARAPAGTGRLIITDGVFLMEGDAAPLRALRQLADVHGARLIVDSAHDLGMLGRRGAGLSELCGLEERTDIITATFSKALGRSVARSPVPPRTCATCDTTPARRPFPQRCRRPRPRPHSPLWTSSSPSRSAASDCSGSPGACTTGHGDSASTPARRRPRSFRSGFRTFRRPVHIGLPCSRRACSPTLWAHRPWRRDAPCCG